MPLPQHARPTAVAAHERDAVTAPRRAALALASIVASVLLNPPPVAHAADWRLAWDTRYRAASFRGFEIDSIPAGEVVTRSDGSLFTPDGIAVRIRPGSAFATFFRPGPERRVGPLSTTIDAAAWGLGVSGLSVRATGRLLRETGVNPSPSVEPSARFLEGYAEWVTAPATVRAGRMNETSRFGFFGYDGGRGEARLAAGRLALATFAGWGMARGVELPATNSALDPLDEFLPERRQLVWGANGRWRSAPLQTSLLYLREVDPRADDFVSERVGGEAVAVARGIELAAGSDYDVADNSWGRAEATVAMRRARASAEIGWRRYAPHFPLWTVWGAFSPVPYHAASARAHFRAARGLDVEASGERWKFDETGATAPLVSVEDRGWRWSAGLRWFRDPRWEARGTLWREFGPGAASLGVEAGASWELSRALDVSADFSWLRRPLEYRFDEANVGTWGMHFAWDPRGRFRASADVQRVDESRDRPDAAAFDWTQWRIGLSTTVEFDSGAARGVPPAVLRIPELPK